MEVKRHKKNRCLPILDYIDTDQILDIRDVPLLSNGFLESVTASMNYSSNRIHRKDAVLKVKDNVFCYLNKCKFFGFFARLFSTQRIFMKSCKTWTFVKMTGK